MILSILFDVWPSWFRQTPEISLVPNVMSFISFLWSYSISVINQISVATWSCSFLNCNVMYIIVIRFLDFPDRQNLGKHWNAPLSNFWHQFYCLINLLCARQNWARRTVTHLNRGTRRSRCSRESGIWPAFLEISARSPALPPMELSRGLQATRLVSRDICALTHNPEF
jgi:hypothetical protein